jgi:hypothetical protein
MKKKYILLEIGEVMTDVAVNKPLPTVAHEGNFLYLGWRN